MTDGIVAIAGEKIRPGDRVVIDPITGRLVRDVKPGDDLVQRVHWMHASTVAEVLDWCAQHDLDPAEVTVTSTHLKWRSPSTQAERDRLAEVKRSHDERHEEWERETMGRLAEKYGYVKADR